MNYLRDILVHRKYANIQIASENFKKEELKMNRTKVEWTNFTWKLFIRSK